MMEKLGVYRGKSVVTGEVIEGTLFVHPSSMIIANTYGYEVDRNSVEKFMPDGNDGRWELVVEI